MAQTVVGIFNSASEAQDAASKLIANGFSENNVDVSSGNNATSGMGNSDYNTMSANPGTPDFATGYSNSNLGATEMTGTTGITGASGLNERSTNSAHSDNEESGISKFFKNLFGSDNDDSDRFSKVASGGAIVTVHAQTAEEAEQVADLLDEYGAVDVDDVYSQNYGADNVYGNTTTDQYNTASDSDTDTTVGTTGGSAKSIPIIEESLQVGKKEIETGGVRLRSRIVERPVEESLRLREEFVRIQRNPVNRPATTADLDNFQEGTIEMTETAEIPVVSKEARVVEEVSIGKEVEHHDEVIRDTVRKTEVEIEQLKSENRTTGLEDDLSSSSRV